MARDPSSLAHARVALVLGAKTYDGYLSQVLKDRVDAAIMLRRRGLVDKLLLSGDHGQASYDEVNNMKAYVLRNAPEIDEKDISLDQAGFDTYDSIVRAREVFCVDSVIVVTQDFHSYLATYLARTKGLAAQG